ncbi:AAA family ATPase [uncultured Methanobrevibacter sp.]|uniref:AAA family ATPase n=1 Tax=uncultured Methanobrevibacter sp. TaxID=253161 RepID=UPI0025F8EE09|nr:AAA family ATPase [uncultured Methanobrevibacter sp.]
MSVNWKICDNCNHKVNIVAKKCPYCNNDSFKILNKNDVSIKDEISELYEYCNLIDNRGVYNENITPILAEFKSEGGIVKDKVQIELANFLTFICVEGESFSISDVAFIKETLGFDYSYDELYQILTDNLHDNVNFLPFSFKLLYENDLFHKDFLEKKNLKGYTSRLYEIYIDLGESYIKSSESCSKHQIAFKKFMEELVDEFVDFKNGYADGSYDSPKLNDVTLEDIDDSKWNIQGMSDEDLEFYKELSEKRPDEVADMLLSSGDDIKINKKSIPEEDSSEELSSEENEETLDDVLEELNKLVGLEVVKKEVNSLVNLIQIRKIRQERGMKQPPMSLHLVFSGNPGTGKTTVARLLSKIYAKLGILSKGHLVETDRSGLVGGYLGQTAIKTQEVIQNAMGGILFIDEAYTLSPKNQEDSYGQEAIDTILKAMEDHRDDLIVIVAGYPELMEKFIHSNPGLESRFNKYIFFEDYNPEELYGIFISMCENSSLKLDSKADDYLKGLCEDIYNTRGDNFANARQIRNIFENVLTAQANRLSGDEDITDDELMTIVLEDFKLSN